MRAFVVSTPCEDVDLASDVLWSLGVRAIEERAAANGVVELWTAVGEEPAALERAATALAGRWESRVEVVDDTRSETWREFAAPMWVGDSLVVVPAWQEHDVDSTATVISIEPGGAFGLGDHPTTALTLGALSTLVGPDTDVLDVGCGTGVLAIAAALLGARTTRAVDIASVAVEVTRDNARRNGVADRVEVDTTPLGDLDGLYGLVVANILAPTLIELSADLRRLTAPGGHLVVSGVLTDRHDHVLDALAPFEVIGADTLEGWAAVTLLNPHRP